MARPKKTDAPNLAQRIDLTVGVIERLACPPGKQQAFLRDSEVPGLRVRVTAAGAKSFVFESKLDRRTVRCTLGDVRVHSIAAARAWAREQAVLIDSGTTAKEVARQQAAEQAELAAAQAAAEAAAVREAEAQAVTVRSAWDAYLAERKPFWGDRSYADHIRMAQEGGVERKRMRGVQTVAGPLAEFMSLRLVDLTPEVVEGWAVREATTRPARVRLALRLLKAFLRWAAAEKEFKGRADPTAANARKAREAAGRAKAKDDVLERGQLAAWFEKVRGLDNPVVAAYLQVTLLTGARPGEVLTLRWADLNEQWKGLTIRDKVEGERVIPLTPYVESLLAQLPRRNQWIFSSTRAVSMEPRHVKRRQRYHAPRGSAAPEVAVVEASATGHISEPRAMHSNACAAAGLDGLTLHGLRRSFASLTEWLEIPAGVVAQIQGHKPSATAEKHYKRRPLDLLRVHHTRIEAWILEQAGVAMPQESLAADQQPPRLTRIA